MKRNSNLIHINKKGKLCALQNKLILNLDIYRHSNLIEFSSHRQYGGRRRGKYRAFAFSRFPAIEKCASKVFPRHELSQYGTGAPAFLFIPLFSLRFRACLPQIPFDIPQVNVDETTRFFPSFFIYTHTYTPTFSGETQWKCTSSGREEDEMAMNKITFEWGFKETNASRFVVVRSLFRSNRPNKYSFSVGKAPPAFSCEGCLGCECCGCSRRRHSYSYEGLENRGNSTTGRKAGKFVAWKTIKILCAKTIAIYVGENVRGWNWFSRVEESLQNIRSCGCLRT